ncbi:helix-turn-helix domain-containing protein [Streptomyces sp. NPDC090108]|uniref:helix-turn-helix domain-containing protein n=1 Tax=Streptomyces sp. NPDC090108 TaxID=3365947 RepID=UPI003815D2A7
MTNKKRNAPPRSKSAHPRSGVHHVKEPLLDNFTVVGNDLAQHKELSLVAIGLALHIQSLPEGAPIGIKVLAAKFPEGEIRIAAALRELEEHGYLTRARERLQSGQLTTRTTSFNKPRRALLTAAVAAAAAGTAADAAADSDAGASRPKRERPVPPRAAVTGRSGASRAGSLLAGLRAHDSRLLLAERDVHRLAPLVTEWLDRGVPPTAVERVLTADLPQDPIKHPAALLNHRLTAQLPPHLPAPAARPPEPSRPDPLQTCDGCDRAFRAPAPGRCRACRDSSAAA